MNCIPIWLLELTGQATLVSNQAYISATSSDSVTISGSPAILDQFFAASKEFTQNRVQLPVHGPYHAEHVHIGVDPKTIVQPTNSEPSCLLSTYKLALPLISSSSGQSFKEDLDASELLAAVLDDIMKQTLSFENVVDGCTRLVRDSKASKCNMVSFGPNSAEDLIAKALRPMVGISILTHADYSANTPKGFVPFGNAPRTSKKPKLAIVGMAGRFPNAADHEKFWDLLEAGLDVHRKVMR